MLSMFAAEEDRFESRNLDDSDAHSEATGTTEEDLRPVKVSCSPVCTALYMHAFIPSVSCRLIHAFAHPLSQSFMHAFIHSPTFVSQATKHTHLVTDKGTISEGLFPTALPLLVSIRPGAHPGT